MTNKYKHKHSNKIISWIIKTILFLILSVGSIELGALGGEALFDSNLSFIQKIDVENFKSTLNTTLPMINTVYNSGNISVSFANELQSLIKGIFGFDLNTPVTILNSQSSVFYCYYNKGYQPFRVTQNVTDANPSEVNEIKKPEESPEAPELKEDSSSTYYEGEDEERDIKEGDIIKDDVRNITINNETKYKINIDDLLKQPLKLKSDKKGPKVLIYHTHTTESFLLDKKQIGAAGIPNWSTNPQNTVVRVGEELAQNLRKKYGIDVIHNGTIHDYPNYNSSYSKSLVTANKILQSYPSIKVVIDLHRDGLAAKGKKLRAVTKVNGKNAAQVMFVVGTDQRKGLNHPNWRENLKFALKLQDKLNQISPGLAKPIDLSFNRYNQHVSNGALIVEVGGDGNLLEECLESTKYLSKAIHDVVNSK
ncbi:MAG: stage II sporulation protein P [Clostridia bacterium]|nr:stage II sporulation protein P [Clostridia bacterium]